MPDSQSVDGERRRETQLEQLDRNLEELTGELRVIVTGVQVLFAFLLIVPSRRDRDGIVFAGSVLIGSGQTHLD